MVFLGSWSVDVNGMLGVVNSERGKGMAESWGKIVDVRLQECQFRMRPLLT